MNKWIRYRFHANLEDSRPVIWPPLGPWWETAIGENYATVVAYLPAGADLRKYWPEADCIDHQERGEIQYTERFPKPEWWSFIENNGP